MTKPNVALVRWADGGGATLVPPISGRRDVGFESGLAVPSGIYNSLMNEYYLWFSFFDPLFTSGGGFAAAVNEHVAVSGTGRHAHGDMILNVPTSHGIGSGWSWDSANGYLASTGAGTWSVAIPTIVGWRLKLVTFERYGDASADLTGDVMKRAKASSAGSLFGISVTDPAASYVDEPCNIVDVAAVDGDSFWINLTASAANLRIGEIRVTYDFPAV